MAPHQIKRHSCTQVKLGGGERADEDPGLPRLRMKDWNPVRDSDTTLKTGNERPGRQRRQNLLLESPKWLQTLE